MAFKSQRDSGYGFIDEGGKVVIAPNFNVVENFRNGRAIVKIIHKGIAPKYGLIDKRGKYIISPDYNDIYFVDKDRLAVGLTIDRKNLINGSSQYAIADTDGRFLTGFDYYSISFYEKGISSVSNFVQTFFIDKAGKKLTSLPTVEGFGKLQIMEDRIKGDIDGRVRYFDLAGQIIWKGKGIISLSNKFLIKEKKFNPKQNYLVYYPQIIGMVNSATQLKTNKALKRASTQIISQSNLGKGYRGDYSLLFHKKNLLVICFSGASYSNGDNPKAQWQSYVHLNLINGKTYTLGDLFDQEIMYVKVLSKIIKEKINKGKEKSSFWSHKYKGIHPNQTFCIGENALQIFFKPGEIGPYSLGAPSFTIGFKEIISSINREGEFWQGFN